MDRRKIIILWKFRQDKCYLPKGFEWKEDKGVVCIDSLPVDEDNNAFLTPIILPAKITAKEDFKAILDSAAGKVKRVNHIILVHENTEICENKITENDIKEYHKELNYGLFGDGKGVIYDKLLFDVVGFKETAFNQDNNKIKKEVFDTIWYEYLKKKMIRLKFDFLSDCLPIVIDIRGLKECAKRKDDAENYLGKITKEDWALFSKDSLNKYDWPSAELREDIEKVINQIAFLGEMIEKSKVPKDVIDEMKNKQFNIDDWYSGLEKCFEQYIQDKNRLL